MANNTNWIEKFKISEALKAEFESASSVKSFLVWCLEQGHVNESDYLSWASQEFQLPVVNADFFANDEVKQQWRVTWTTARFLHQWNPSLLPLDESVGVVRVGCLEVPELKLEQSVAYVLAPLSGMKSLWSEAFPQPVAEQSQTAVMVEVTAPKATPTNVVSDNLPPAPAPQEFDANSLMANWGTPESETDSPPAQPDEEAAQAPDGFAMPEGFSSAASTSESVIDIPVPQVDIPMPVMAKPAEASSAEPSSPPVVPAPEVVEQAAPSPTIVVKAKPPIPPMSPAAQGKSVGDFVGMIELRNAKEKLDDCQDLTEVANATFTRFSRYFDRHMILMMKGFELRPHIWAGNWNLRSARPAGINLDQPSIFRIVSRTKLPFHGYTKPSASNDMFFGEWNNGPAPAHVTILPIVVKDQLVGMLLGATDGSLDAKLALMDAERWMDELTPHFARTKALPPKAA